MTKREPRFSLQTGTTPNSGTSRWWNTDYESSVTMKIKCKRLYIAIIISSLIFVYASSSIYVVFRHSRLLHQYAESDGVTGDDGDGDHDGDDDDDDQLHHQMTGTQEQQHVAAQKPQQSRALRGDSDEHAIMKGRRQKGKQEHNRHQMKQHQKPQGGQRGGGKPSPANKDDQKVKRKQKDGSSLQKEKDHENKKARDVPDIHTPRAESLQANATFSACLLIRDDNDILPEWIAYHYHVLKLRQIIVAVDPLSLESPSEIFAKWRLMTNMDIAEWTDKNYMPGDFLKHNRPPKENMQKKEDFPDPDALLEVSNHRYRQRVFLAQCMNTFRQKGQSWVMHIDTDEFVVPSKLLRQMRPRYLTLPSMEEPNAVLTLLQQTVAKTSKQVNYPCMSMLRVLFGSVESTQEEQENDVPIQHFNSTSFETLRWRYHALPHDMKLHGNPKVLLDVAAIPQKYFQEDIVFSIHRPIKEYCHINTDLDFTHFRHQPIGINHYLGSWERYAGRNDKRRNRAVYDAKASVHRGEDDGARLWLQGFVRNVGLASARTLLGHSYWAQNNITLAAVLAR